MTKEQLKEYRENCEKNFLHRRFPTRKDFIQEIKNHLPLSNWKEEEFDAQEEHCKIEDFLDYSITVSIFKDCGYVDFYYLYDLRNQIVVTEIFVSDE